MRKGGVKCPATSNEDKLENEGLSDSDTSRSDGVIVVTYIPGGSETPGRSETG